MAEKKESSFESMLERLEQIVHELDNAQTPLEDSLKLFEEGAQLIRLLNEKLDSAQQRVNILVRSPSTGEVVEQPYTAENE